MPMIVSSVVRQRARIAGLPSAPRTNPVCAPGMRSTASTPTGVSHAPLSFSCAQNNQSLFPESGDDIHLTIVHLGFVTHYYIPENT